MELSFATEELRALCESRRRSRKRLGEEASRGLEQLLADIEACSSLSELVKMFPDEIVSLTPEQWLAAVSGACRVTLVSGHLKSPVTATGVIDWNRVVRVRIMAVEVNS